MELKDLAPLLLKKERASGDVLPWLLTPLLRGSAQLSARRKRLEGLVATHPVLSQRDFVFQNHAQRYNSALEKMFHYVKLLQEHGISDPVDQQMLYVSIGERLPIDVHRAMFIPTLENQADAQQQRQWLPLARSYKIFGAYAQTELGHGSNVQGLETTATFDVATQQFVIDSPTLTSRKWWPGGLGKTATHAIIHARLFLDGGNGSRKDVGIQAFIVPLRSLATHEPLAGVELGDIGPKVGFNSVDNGYAVFHKVRIPRENMLMKYAQVLSNGSFVKPKSDKLVYLTMVQVRAYLILKFGYIIGSAATITTRFSAARVQGSLASHTKKGELQVLDYQNQQHALLPYIALSYAATFAGQAMSAMHDSALATIKSGADARTFEGKLAELHAVSSGLKAWLADAVGIGIEALRRLCGGHGFTQSSNLAHIFAEIVGASTFEGTFDVLVQQHARFLVKTAKSTGEQELQLFRAKCRAQTAEDFGDLAILLEAFKVRATRATHDLVKAMKTQRSESSKGNGSNPHMVFMTKASVANSEFALLQAFVQGVDKVPVSESEEDSGNTTTKQAVANLCALFGAWLLVKSLGEFRENDYLSSQQGELARQQLVNVLPVVRRNAVLLTDAWDFSDFELNSA
ncbi:Acyl-coenzyme a oxidase, partial [Globisporangium polare]